MEQTSRTYFWLYTILLAVSALWWPFLVSCVIFVAGCFFFRRFTAGLIIMIFMDALYALEGVDLMPFSGVISVGAIAVFFAARFLRERLFHFGK